MDKNPISQTWVSDIFQRFEAGVEAVFQDVDDFVNKDPVKFVENQMQSVGESVNKFFNGVLQDIILPPLYTNSVSSVKETTKNKSEERDLITVKENCDKQSPTCEISKSPVVKEEEEVSKEGGLIEENCHRQSPTCEISKSPVQEEETKPNLQNEENDEIIKTSFEEEEILDNTILENNNSVFEDDMNSDKMIEGGQLECPIFDEESENVLMERSIDDEFECDLDTLSNMESLIGLNENKEEKMCDNLSSAKSYYSSSSSSSSSSMGVSVSSHDLSTSDFSDASLAYSNFALVDGMSDELDESMVDFEDVSMENIELIDAKELVESCVIVKGENVISFPYGPGRSKSYKKIIRDAFISRKKLTKEYRQLAVLCGGSDKEFIHKRKENAIKVQAEDFPVSEWEIL